MLPVGTDVVSGTGEPEGQTHPPMSRGSHLSCTITLGAGIIAKVTLFAQETIMINLHYLLRYQWMVDQEVGKREGAMFGSPWDPRFPRAGWSAYCMLITQSRADPQGTFSHIL